MGEGISLERHAPTSNASVLPTALMALREVAKDLSVRAASLCYLC